MNIVITGASRGIGFDTAIALAQHKTNSVTVLSRNTDQLNQLKKIAVRDNLDIDTYPLDLKNFDEDILVKSLSKYNQVDILINNAGVLLNKSFRDTSLDEWKDIFDTNFFGTVKLIKCLLPLIGKSPVAHIVNIGSMGGYTGSSKFPGLSAYSASKAALANLTECLAEEFKPLNIIVNCLALGSVNTEMLNFIADFAMTSYKYFNGKILPVSLSTP
jgi:short-subunit dehydrogenase